MGGMPALSREEWLAMRVGIGASCRKANAGFRQDEATTMIHGGDLIPESGPLL